LSVTNARIASAPSASSTVEYDAMPFAARTVEHDGRERLAARERRRVREIREQAAAEPSPPALPTSS
jgi:hypothetical protein